VVEKTGIWKIMIILKRQAEGKYDYGITWPLCFQIKRYSPVLLQRVYISAASCWKLSWVLNQGHAVCPFAWDDKRLELEVVSLVRYSWNSYKRFWRETL